VRKPKQEEYAYGARVALWLSRGPIGERGGVNLYGMVGNNAVNKWDYLDLSCCCIESIYVDPTAPAFKFVPYRPSAGIFSLERNGKYKVPFTFKSDFKHDKSAPASPCTFTWTETWRGSLGPWYALGVPGTYLDREFGDNLTRDAEKGKSMASIRDVPGMVLDATGHAVSKVLNLTIKIDGESPGMCCKLKRWAMEITIYMQYDGATGNRVIGAERFRTTVRARP